MLLYGGNAYAITLGQVQDFEDGMTDWEVGSGGNPAAGMNANVPTVVSSSELDNLAMKLTATGDPNIMLPQPGGRLSAINNVFTGGIWTGDYTAQGVTTLRMDLHNPSDVALTIQLLMVSVDATGLGSVAAVLLGATLVALLGAITTALPMRSGVRAFRKL